jgi:hypothetical protein
MSSLATTPATPAPVAPVSPSTTQTQPATFWSVLTIILGSFGGVFAFLLHAAAAKLSYDKYQSVGWAILDFIFGSVYIPYYAFFLNTPSSQPAMGGRGRRR